MTEITEHILIEHGFKQVDEFSFENDLFTIRKNFYSPKHPEQIGWRIHLKNHIHPYLLPSHIQSLDQLQTIYKIFTQKEL